MGTVCLTLFASADGGLGATPELVAETKGGWRVTFDSAKSMLECVHASTGLRLAGSLEFMRESGDKATPWKIELARDSASGRLALVDGENNAQGYVTFSVDAARVELRVLARPPQFLAGSLRYSPQVRLGAQAFACRTRVPDDSSVLQMASGPADSGLNDSVFDPEADRVLRFGAKECHLRTLVGAGGQLPEFVARLAAQAARSDEAVITLELLADYYRSRYVPNYRLIDRRRCPTPPTGWMSWNAYFDTAGEVENLAEARVGAQFLKPYGLEIWSIESWQDNSPKLPVSDFHNLTLRPSPVKFPHGMAWLAGQIRELGFRPGIWTVPWGTGDEKFYQAHRDWFLHRPDGKPMANWNGRFVLDPSLPEVRQHMENSHRTMARDWGYEFFKIDGMSGTGPGYSAHFFERPEVRAAFRQPVQDPYNLCVEALRQGIGPDRIFLACQGHYSGAEVAWADAARLGADIVEPNHPPRWANYLNQARVTQNQLFTHNIVWYNDPDTLMVGVTPLNEARIATTVVALPGQLTFFGDKLGQLPPERMRLLQQALPVCPVRPLDLAPVNSMKPVWDLKIQRPFGAWDVVSLFNWGEAEREVECSAAGLGLDENREYLAWDFWRQEFCGDFRGRYAAKLAPHTSQLLAVHASLDRPQFLATDRHISQGGVELLGEAWNAATRELTCRFQLVASDRLTAVIHCPVGFRLAKTRADGAVLDMVDGQTGPILRATLQRNDSGVGVLVMGFAE